MLSFKEQKLKRLFDLAISLPCLFLLGLPIILLILMAASSTKKSGLFSQLRVGKDGRLFKIFKIRTMRADQEPNVITTLNDPRITRLGHLLRATKLDELPQLYNVLIGEMSLVGPRPDVAGYADKLKGEDRIILSVKPGITGPATIKYKNEEWLLATQKDAKSYNDNIIWPDKVKINKAYINDWSFKKDLVYIFKTFFN